MPLAVTATYASVMVLLEQRTPDGQPPFVRTLDLRLRVTGGAWAVDEVPCV